MSLFGHCVKNRWTWVDSIEQEDVGLISLLPLCFPTSSVEWRTGVSHCMFRDGGR